jgi:hypothetical protein
MESGLLQNLRTANQAITRFVSELSATKASPQPQSYSLHLDSLVRQLNKIEKALGSVSAPGSRDPVLDAELRIYAINLRLLKKAIEELEPLLREKVRVLKEAMARLGATRSWSESLKDLST